MLIFVDVRHTFQRIVLLLTITKHLVLIKYISHTRYCQNMANKKKILATEDSFQINGANNTLKELQEQSLQALRV